MSEEVEPREPNKLQLAIALAQGRSLSAWARANGVAKTTAQRWSREPEVLAEIEAYRRRAIARAVAVFARHAGEAAQGIWKLSQAAESESVKLRALRAVLGDMMAASKYSGLDERMAQLKEYVKEQRGAGSDLTPDVQA